jgi:hypothetical protein
MRIAFSALFAILAALPGSPAPREEDRVKLWAAISVNDPVIEEDRVKESLRITFSVVNDGRKTINGKELHDWRTIIMHGARDDRFEALPPGDFLVLTKGLGPYFAKCGVYKVRWKGTDFETAEIVLRVIPSKEKS